jgi:hypothetical protein
MRLACLAFDVSEDFEYLEVRGKRDSVREALYAVSEAREEGETVIAGRHWRFGAAEAITTSAWRKATFGKTTSNLTLML